MDYAVFQDCVKSMDLRQRFQKLQDEIYILNKNRELVPNLECTVMAADPAAD